MNRKKYNEAMLSIDAKVVEKAKNIKLLILDVDGVMTDGGVIINKDGSESKQFYAQDGHGLMILKSLNIEYAIISGRYSKAVEFRGNELGFKTIIQNSRDKLADYKKHFSDFLLTPIYFFALKNQCVPGAVPRHEDDPEVAVADQPAGQREAVRRGEAGAQALRRRSPGGVRFQGAVAALHAVRLQDFLIAPRFSTI